MSKLIAFYDRLVRYASGHWGEGIALFVTRLALAGIFWRSYLTKVEEGSWFTLSDTTYFLFETEYSAVPLPPAIAAPLATYAEFCLPVLVVLGLATRFAALGLLIMTGVIQLFVYPQAWWSVHIVWMALCLVLMARGAGVFAADHWLHKARRP